MALQGSCLCGGVRFEVSEPFAYVTHCHCEFCKRIAGGYGTVSGRAPTEAIRVARGRGAPPLLHTRGRLGEDVLLDVRVEPLRRRLAGVGDVERAPVVVRTRLRPQARGAHLRPVGRGLGDPSGGRAPTVRDPRHLTVSQRIFPMIAYEDTAAAIDWLTRGVRLRRARRALRHGRTARSATPSSSSAARS